PVKVLKSDISANVDRKNIPWLRHVLVITQFTLTVLLMICSVIVFDQVKFLHQKDLGFNKDQIMFFPMRSDFMLKNPDAFKNDLLRLPGVSSVSVGYGFPGDAVAGDEIIVDQRGQHTTHPATQLTVDFDYIKTLGLHIVAGRDFSKSVSTDKDHGWIINETAVREFGYKSPQDALGKYLYWHPWDGNNPDSLKTGQIIGVVKDFNYASLYDKIGGAVIQIYPQAAWKVAVKMHTTGIAKTIASVGAVWAKYSPDFPMEYQFLDENFSGMYASEEKLETLLWIFTGVAIFVGCLGMLGLSAFTAERRKKELGIRKVLGATTSGLLLLLARETIKLIFLALLIASPLGWYFMNKWLQNFAYQIDISWWIFIFAGMGTILIAAVTISFNGWKAARASPVKNLRTE
ncbi:MAG TPA: FtsX-like permease family protein, partial [Puia sp.]|nr:FtsX-like permease family protein [Puia sp.]